MADSLHAAYGKVSAGRTVDLDETIEWGCSLKGWNCCVDQAIPVRPYDMVRLRHALGAPAEQLVDRQVMLAWHPQSGTLLGSLAHQPYEGGRNACIFLEEITNVTAREMCEHEPERFETMPERVRRAAESEHAGEWRVAALCRAHLNRPEVCRGFPFQRFVEQQTDGSSVIEVRQVFRCGSCALSTPTTVRELLGGEEDVAEYWRATDAYWPVENYLVSLGAARIAHPQYRRLPAEPSAEIWRALFLPDGDPEIAARLPEQWRAGLDVEGDREIFRTLLLQALDRVDELVVSSGREPDALGFEGVTWVRPDVDALLDPSRPAFAPPPAPPPAPEVRTAA